MPREVVGDSSAWAWDWHEPGRVQVPGRGSCQEGYKSLEGAGVWEGQDPGRGQEPWRVQLDRGLQGA